ncbi:hypothetical protein HMI56_001997 [Coelomomyces lativittatus]|nr:hypothetical protein HMI56_001997 [Coelomomyces lativittatus]
MHSLLRRFHQHGFLGSTPSSFHAPRFTSTHSLPTSPPSKEEDPPPLPSYLELPDDPIVEIKDLRSSTLYHPLIPPPINWKQGSLTQERTTEADHHLLIGVQQQGTPPLDVPSDASARAVVSRVSIDLEDARKRILRLYRHWLVKVREGVLDKKGEGLVFFCFLFFFFPFGNMNI